MPSDVPNGVALGQGVAKLGEAVVLCIFKKLAIQAFQLNANAVVIAVGTASVSRSACVPSALVATDKLPEFARSLNEKMRRHLQATNALKVGVSFPIELVGEELLNSLPAVFAGRQADGVHHDQVNVGLVGARTKVGRFACFSTLVPTGVSHIKVHVVSNSSVRSGLAVRLGTVRALAALHHVLFWHVQAAVFAGQHGAGCQVRLMLLRRLFLGWGTCTVAFTPFFQAVLPPQPNAKQDGQQEDE